MRILLADSRTSVRSALQALLRHRTRARAIGEASNAEELLSKARRLRPDLVVLDWDLPGLVADLVPRLRRLCPGLYVIALGVRQEARLSALLAGADAFVSKTEPPEHLLSALWQVEREGGERERLSALTLQIPQGCDDNSPS